MHNSSSFQNILQGFRQDAYSERDKGDKLERLMLIIKTRRWYILNLLRSVINVSLQTVEIVEGLPKVEFGESGVIK
jgi:hypothetical protein